VYTDSSITSNVSERCSCPAKTLDKKGGVRTVFNTFGYKIKEEKLSPGGSVSLITTWKYDEFGTAIERRIVDPEDPSKLNKSKTILEYYTDQASIKTN